MRDWLIITTFFTFFATLSHAASSIRDKVEASLSEIKNKIIQKYPDLSPEQIKLFNIQYNYADPGISKIFEPSYTMFQEQTKILFVTNEKPQTNEKDEKKELVIEGVLVILDTEYNIKNIEKGFHTRSAFKKPDGTFGEYNTLGFESERSYRYSRQGGVPVQPVKKPIDPGSIKMDWAKTNKELQEKAEQGDPEAQYRLAMNMILGLGFDKNKESLEKASALLKRAETSGYSVSKIRQAEQIIINQSATNPQQNP